MRKTLKLLKIAPLCLIHPLFSLKLLGLRARGSWLISPYLSIIEIHLSFWRTRKRRRKSDWWRYLFKWSSHCSKRLRLCVVLHRLILALNVLQRREAWKFRKCYCLHPCLKRPIRGYTIWESSGSTRGTTSSSTTGMEHRPLWRGPTSQTEVS